MNAYSFITAGDKDIAPIVEKMCNLATTDLFDFMKETIQANNQWESVEDKLKEAHEKIREDMFLDQVFGSYSKITNAEFIDAVVKKTEWMFNSNSLR